ncbi:MAG TPA: VOC family protein [Acidimicrobiales bacterium]|nr:VOC family protein [Acidimicrobiales bacterium]
MTKTDAAGERSVASQVEVPTDPDTAFKAFTEELDLWWVRGPINHWAAGKVRALRCEPGVGGRLLEVYDDSSGDALELARITVWEPGRRLAWQSSLDDVQTEVSFEPSDGSTRVEVTARIPAGGTDRGGTSWTRVVPKWFGAWCRRRESASHQVTDIARLALAVSYLKPSAAARWLAAVFGFESPDPLPQDPDPLPSGDHGHPWIEFRIGNSSLMVFPLDGETPEIKDKHIPWVYVDDIEDHFRRAEAAGASIVQKLDAPWGLPMYVAADLEGNHWTFAQARPTM